MSSTATAPVKYTSRRLGWRDTLRALPWIGPGIILIGAIVLFPAFTMFFNSTRDISKAGIDRGSAGTENYAGLFEMSALPGVFLRTILWVILVVGLTIVVSLVLANFLNKQFPGRQIVRLAVIIPWASSVIMTTTVIYYGFEPNFGIFQKLLYDLGILSSPDFGFTKSMPWAFIISIAIAVFVSLPFTTYTLLAGHQAIGHDVLEAARVDGAHGAKLYFRIVLPQLRPALAVSTIINIINVFNNFPILKVVTGALPGYGADTTTTLMFKILQDRRDIGMASALSVLNFAVVMAIIGVYIWRVKPMKGVDE